MTIYLDFDAIFKWIGIVLCAVICLWPFVQIVFMWWVFADPIGTWKWNRSERKRLKEKGRAPKDDGL